MIIKRKSFSFFNKFFKRKTEADIKYGEEGGKLDLIQFYSLIKDNKINFPHISKDILGISYHNFGDYTFRAIGVDRFGVPKKLDRNQSKIVKDNFNNLKTYMTLFLEDHPNTNLTINDIELYSVFLDRDKNGELNIYFVFEVTKTKGDSKKGYTFEYSVSLDQ